MEQGPPDTGPDGRHQGAQATLRETEEREEREQRETDDRDGGIMNGVV